MEQGEREPAITIDVLSLFPEYFSGPFDQSMIKQAKEKGIVALNLVDIRDFAEGRHRRVDDRPYGGGPGMVMMAEPVAKAVRSRRNEDAHVVYLSPQGSPLTTEKCIDLAKKSHLVMLCGHYEGIDERIIETEVDEEISIGDYVLTNGCIAAIVVIDALLRFVPGFIGHEDAAWQDSFTKGLLDCPHYTRPEVFEGKKVPEVLLSGNHEEIRKWREKKALKKTASVRPDLIE